MKIQTCCQDADSCTKLYTSYRKMWLRAPVHEFPCSSPSTPWAWRIQTKRKRRNAKTQHPFAVEYSFQLTLLNSTEAFLKSLIVLIQQSSCDDISIPMRNEIDKLIAAIVFISNLCHSCQVRQGATLLFPLFSRQVCLIPSVTLSADHLKAAYGWGEGIEILFEKGRYVCIRHLEKATNMETLVDEAQAVALFIQMACHSKSSVFWSDTARRSRGCWSGTSSNQ